MTSFPNRQWASDFYRQQNAWFGAYLRPIEALDQERAAFVKDWSGILPPASLLELGGGGGQTLHELQALGYYCTMIELLPDSVAHAQSLMQDLPLSQRPALYCADFYTWQAPQCFELIVYFDSFGLGSDAEQQTLLQRMATWLGPQGRLIIEVGSARYWSGPALGQCYDIGGFVRQHDFDFEHRRLLDHWWPSEDQTARKTQYLRCYDPEEWPELLKNTGLKILDFKPGGKVDYLEQRYLEEASMEDCMTYYILLEKA